MKLANYLSEKGIGLGSRVITMLPNSPELICLWLALSRLQAVAIPVNIHYKALALRHIIDDSKSDCIIFHHEQEEDILHAVSIFDNFGLLIGLGNCRDEKILSFDDFRTKALFGGPFNPDGHNNMVMFYSGASTGPAKTAIYRNKSINKNAAQYLSAVSYKPDDTIMVQYSLNHPIGYVAVFNACIMAGASIAIVPENNRDQILETALSTNPTYFVGEPGFFNIAARDIREDEFPESIKYCITGGGRLKSESHNLFIKRFKRQIFKVYGMIESGPILTVNTDKEKYTSVGIPISDIPIAVMRDGRPVTDDSIGEICIPSSALNPYTADNVKDNILDGWYYTGDLGCFDMDGYLYFVDRKAYLINVNGFDVYPEQVEMVLSSHPDIEESVVTGTPKNSRTEEIHAHIIPVKGKNLSADYLKDFLKDKLPAYQIPEKFNFVNHFPRSATGKIVRRALK